MKRLLISLAAVLAFSAQAAHAGDDDIDPRTVKMAQSVCETCHGIGGDSPYSLYPRLAGQQTVYLQHELKQFRSRERGDPFAQAYMWGIAAPLSDVEIDGLAQYFSNKKPGEPIASDADAEVLARGKALFDHGDESKGIPACSSCHGDSAEGKDDFPRLAGQHAAYLVRQIVAFRTMTRRNDTMHTNAENISDDDAEAVAEYLSQK